MTRSLFQFFSSIRLTLFLLTASLILIFFGTLDQVQYGIYFTQQKYFEHVFVIWEYPPQWIFGQELDWLHLPLPGGYFLGPLLIINLACAHFRYFRPSWKKAGIPLIHGGVVLLLIGQLWTQLLQIEYFLWLGEGEDQNFVEAFHYDEFVLIDKSDPQTDTVYSWDARALRKEGTVIRNANLPFSVEVLWYARNAAIFPRPENSAARFPDLPANRGIAADRDLLALPQRPTFAEGERNVTAAVVRLRDREDQPIGSWLVANIFRQSLPLRQWFPPQTFQHEGREWEIALRFKRQYLPASVKLLDFQHDRYPGTDIPYNFSSEVRLLEPGEESGRRTLIYMNHPLRYAGLTFYQASFADNNTKSMFQVVHNPARWVPYVACAITTIGLVLQFLISLYLHVLRRPRNRPAASPS